LCFYSRQFLNRIWLRENQLSNKFQPVKEADLSRHLENGKDKSTKDKKDTPDADAKQGEVSNSDEVSLASKDYQLYEALNLLKGLYILQQSKI